MVVLNFRMLNAISLVAYFLNAMLSVVMLKVTFSYCNAESTCRYAEFMFNAITLNVIMLCVIMLNVNMLNFIMLKSI